MEHMIQLHIEKLPVGVYLATSDEVQGLVAQGRTCRVWWRKAGPFSRRSKLHATSPRS